MYVSLWNTRAPDPALAEAREIIRAGLNGVGPDNEDPELTDRARVWLEKWGK